MLVPVYDIRNCGPRHQFGANGKLVHNCNWQNFTRGSKIHTAIEPPDGWRIAEPDLSQIECRLCNYFAGQHDKVEDFRQGRDPYVGVASQFYGYEVNKKDHPVQRQVGKVLELQCQFGSGGPKIAATLRTQAKIILEPHEAERAKFAYRDTHPAVVDYWGQAGRMLARLGGGPPIQWGPVEVRDHRIFLPNGCPLIYDTIEYFNDPESGDGYWRVRRRNGWQKLYGAKLVENLIQALARVVVSQAMLRIRRQAGPEIPIVGTKHDSIMLLIRDDQYAEQTLRWCLEQMCVAKDWLEGVPLNAEESKWGVAV